MRFEGYLIDADYISENGKAIIRLWCKDDDGNDFVVLDPNFEPYFYFIPFEWMDPISIRAISARRKDEEIRVKDVLNVTKKLFGKEVEAYKIVAFHPQHVPALREELGKYGDVYEADIPFAFRYITDRGLIPLDGIAAEGDPIKLDYCPRAIVAKELEYVKKEGFPKLKIMAFDTEMAVERGMPDPEKDPISIISIATEEGERMLKAEASDYKIIREFVEFVRNYDPDVIVGYNCDAFDWPYLMERAKKHGISLSIGVDGSEPKYRGGEIATINVAGRQLIDLYRVAKRELGEVKVKTLDNIAEYLGVMKKDERVLLTPRQIYECWKDESMRHLLYEYARADAVSTLKIAEKLLPLQYELARIVRRPLEDVAKMGRGRLVEALLISEAYKVNELVPQKSGDGEMYEGGYVREPLKGIHEDVVCLDFSSMYPSIMIAYNISPDTITTQEDAYVAPEVGHRFAKSPDGFFKRILTNLVASRKRVKEEMEKYAKDSREYRILDIKQQSLKILTNSFYGYTGWKAARWYRKECAEATTAWGRHFIRKAMGKAEEYGLTVIYGDTDSMMLKGERLMEVVEKLRKELSQEIPVELDIENFYKVMFFTEKKKRYAGLTSDGEIVIKGLEVRRGDWCGLAKELQHEIIETILRERNVEKAVSIVKQRIREVREGKVPLEKLIIYKTLTKEPSEYEAKQAHVVAATRAEQELRIGDKISYVIVKGPQMISERAYPVEIFLERKMELDEEYYVHHQILPVALRILHYFGYSSDDLVEETRQQSLKRWMDA